MKFKCIQVFVLSVLALFAEVISNSAYGKSENQWLCISEQAAGIGYDERTHEWRASVFKTKDRFLIRHARKGDVTSEGEISNVVDAAGWSTVPFGSDAGWECEGQSNFNTKNILRCDTILGLLLFNKNALVFQNYSTGMFVFPEARGEKWEHDTPTINIGHCTPL
jgi:hypothetical protein